MLPPQDPIPQTRHPRLLLASQSPQRAKLLRDAGYVFTQQSPPFADPDQPEAVAPHSPAEAEHYAAQLARQKAMSMVQRVAGPAVILAADTLCVSMHRGGSGILIGKPRDRADAEAMIRAFVGRDHAVVSGVALLVIDGNSPPIAASLRDAGSPANPLNPTLFGDTTIVTLGHVPDDALQHYLDSEGWRSKAGGYNLFDRQDAGWPITVQGDPANVVGLPMRKLTAALSKYGIDTPR